MTLSLLASGGCVAISGLGDLEIENDVVGIDGAVVGNGDVAADAVKNEAGGDASGPPTDAMPLSDAHSPFDGAVPDANQPDTGGPESHPAGAGVVQCTSTLQCTDGKACCYSQFNPFPSCISSGSCVNGGTGLECDDDSDCTVAGDICCITPEITSYSANSTCTKSCGSGSFHACTSDATCSGSTTCKHVSLAPAPIKGCQ